MSGSGVIKQLHKQNYQLHLLQTRLYFCHMCRKVLIEINRGLDVDDLLKLILWFDVTIMVINVCFSWANILVIKIKLSMENIMRT